MKEIERKKIELRRLKKIDKNTIRELAAKIGERKTIIPKPFTIVPWWKHYTIQKHNTDDADASIADLCMFF